MPYLHTIRSGWENMRTADVTADESILDGSTSGLSFCPSDRPSHAIKLGQEYNGVQIFFSAGKGFGEGLHEISALPEKECAFQIDGWYSNGPAFKICDGSVTTGESRIFPVAAGHDLSECIACCTITLADQPHPTTISVHNVDNTQGSANITFDTLGMDYIAITFPDVSFPVNAWMRPY